MILTNLLRTAVDMGEIGDDGANTQKNVLL
jgi:hypothetical protein